jgi:hypothetical protein
MAVLVEETRAAHDMAYKDMPKHVGLRWWFSSREEDVDIE